MDNISLYVCICMFLRYDGDKIRCLDTVRSYHTDAPIFLRNRPRHFVHHCLKRIPPKVTHITLSDIVQVRSDVFNVGSKDSDRTYTVTVNELATSSMLSCQCMDCDKHHLPCKHMVAVFQTSLHRIGIHYL